MQTANVATAKNELSRLLRHVKRGETVLITERNHPIARIEPISASTSETTPASLAPLYETGLLTPPRSTSWDVQTFLASLPPTAPLAPGHDLASAILADREESA